MIYLYMYGVIYQTTTGWLMISGCCLVAHGFSRELVGSLTLRCHVFCFAN